MTSAEKDESISRPEPFLTIKENPIYFEEDWNTGIGGGLWSTGKALSVYFVEYQALIRNSFKNLNCKSRKTVDGSKIHSVNALELGSGNGLLSVCLAAVAGDLIGKLVVTDLDDHLNLMEKTMRANTHIVNLDVNTDMNEDESKSDDLLNSRKRPMTVVKEHRWGEFEPDDDEKFDFIFGSDVAYRDFLHEPLIQTLLRYSHEGTISLIGVTMIDTKPKFFTELKENGFTYVRLPDAQMAPEFRGTTFGLFVIQKV